ncbi:hypothetical protein HDU81_003747 [Chytriomyces hyalinus]|nr:hypothetical protein HDU81_003747 [Chytriomyces hyalinus]
MDLSTASTSSAIGLGIMFSPASPADDARRASQPHTSASSPSGTSTACSSRDFMSFTSQFATSICRRMPLKRLSSNIPADMVAYTHHILNTTQVSLSIVVLALRIMKQVQEKLDLLLLQSGNPTKRNDSNEFGGSMKDVELQVLDRLSRRVTVKSLFVVSLMLAMKSPNGCCNTFTNSTWSHVASVPVSILSSIELDVTLLLGFSLWVNEQQYVMWLNTVRIAAEEFSLKTAQFQHHQQQLQLHASQQQQQQQRYAKLLGQQQRARKQIQTKGAVQGHRPSGMPSPSSPSAPNAGFLFDQRRKSFSKGARLAPYPKGEDVMSVQRMQQLMQAMPPGSFVEKVVGMMVPK